MTQGYRWQLPPQNGVAIRVIRERAGTKRNVLAGQVGISESHLRNLETENKSASREHIALLADRLGVPADAITRYPPSHAILYDPPPQEQTNDHDT